MNEEKMLYERLILVLTESLHFCKLMVEWNSDLLTLVKRESVIQV